MFYRFRTILVAPALLAIAVAAIGCGSGGGGQEGATEEQKRDPAWINARLKELDKDPTIKPEKPAKGKAKAAP